MNGSHEIAIFDARIAARLKALRQERGWSLDNLAALSGVSRATLSRLENGDVSPTASALAKLCLAYGLTMSRLMTMMEDDFVPLLHRDAQPVWHDPEIGFERRSVSPPSRALSAEMVEVRLHPGTLIDYDGAPRPGLEHHLYLIEGRLSVTLDTVSHHLVAGDCLRYQLFGKSRFETAPETAAHYILVMV
ncbi:helix-turn-helix domain-containing protein [Acuticoccus sp. M5D2P5]|uniref:helix-turn-helix domain-containing protein n=1 Tax=Acuticoccus kalidii TaxID=2910977 RepID=UPI001F1FB507|nr:helix-turn-helix transcriptional regulator [Acuticoccus kalidii]MCF3932657.1 helix-turn-helix domain-containing protein [Acuticoccus kalidii]